MSTKCSWKAVRLVCVILAAVPLAGCPSAPPSSLSQPTFSQDGDALTHTPSGMLFPQSIGAFQRATPRIYDGSGKDVSVGYNLLRQGNPVVATIYIYPAPPLTSVGSPDYIVNDAREHLLKGEFVRREKEIKQNHPDAALLLEARTGLAGDGMASPGWTADFSYTDHFAAGPAQVWSKLVVAQCPDTHWMAEYRFTYAAATPVDSEIASFMQALTLPVPK